MIKKKFNCGQCNIGFDEAVYWFDSLHFDNWKKRKIIPFCGPKCVQEWHEKTGAINWPQRKKPYPKGDEWKIITQLI